jgi:hypothetical protein
MDDAAPSCLSTPKRKRADVAHDQVPSQLNLHFSFDVSQGLLSDGGDSPRTKVAHRFRGLALADSGGGGADTADGRLHDTEPDPGRHSLDTDSDQMEVDEDESKMRKRSKLTPPSVTSDGSPRLKQQSPSPAQDQLPTRRVEIPETPSVPKTELQAAAGLESRIPSGDGHVVLSPSEYFSKSSAQNAALPSGPAKPAPSKQLKPSSAANKRTLENLKSKGRRRAGTPPLVASNSNLGTTGQPGDTAAAEVIDPVRAALTWHEDEITVYDPDDEDDDGVGINGIGFKPTPAIAYARTQKRKQQLAEYKKREEREARARRSSRRRGSPDRAIKMHRKESAGAENARKVRFTDSESAAMITT